MYCEHEDSVIQQGERELSMPVILKEHLYYLEKCLYDIFVNIINVAEYTLKGLLSDYINILIDVIICIKKNETEGLEARAYLMAKGGPKFLQNFSSQYFNSSSCKWNCSNGEMSVIMKEIEYLYNKIVRLDTDNCPTAATSVKL